MFVNQSTNTLVGQECGVDARSNKVKLDCPHQKNPGIVANASNASNKNREKALKGKPLILTGENGKGVRIGSIGSGSRIRVLAYSRIRVFRTRKRKNNLPQEVKHDIQKK